MAGKRLFIEGKPTSNRQLAGTAAHKQPMQPESIASRAAPQKDDSPRRRGAATYQRSGEGTSCGLPGWALLFLALAALETKHCHTCHEPASTANALETHPD